MKEQYGKKRAFIPLIANVVLLVVGLTIALGMLEMLMRAFPNWVPVEVRVNPPSRRVKALIDDTYDLRQSDGDLFHYMRGSIEPLSPDQDQMIAHIHMVTDANGFRNSPPEKTTYPIVALGDSFTRASGVATPWAQRLAEYTGRDVLNLGDVGFGPQDELKVLRQYGLKKQPQWVILAYFEGNDLYDAASYEQATPLILLRFGKYIFNRSLEAWQAKHPEPVSAAVISNYRYPITMTINNEQMETVFFSSYISWLSLSEEAIAASQNYRLVTKTILEMQELSQSAGANLLLVYVPSKSHVYLPYVKDPETIAQVFIDVPKLELDHAGFIQFTEKTATPELVRQHMDDQAGLFTDFSAANQIHFLNLTPIFQGEAGAGVELYYPYDTHWNQLGHDLAAKTINAYIAEMLPAAASQTPGN